MDQLILASRPLIELTQRSYEVAATSLMMARNFTPELAELNALNKEINQLVELIDHCALILKNTED